jgi:hypothetical protein
MTINLIDDIIFIDDKGKILHKFGSKLGTLNEYIFNANRKMPKGIKDEDQVFYNLVMSHVMEEILFKKLAFIDLDTAYKLRKDENIRESVIKKFYELLGGDPGRFIYLGNLVKKWTKNDIIKLYSQWKAKTGVFILYFNNK